MLENEENVNEDETPAADVVDEAAAEPAAESSSPPDQVAEEVAEPEEQLSPKERRRQERSAHTGEARPQRTIEERAQERAEARRTKAKHRRAYRLKQRERRAGQPRPDSTPVTESASQPNIKVRQGVVVSDKADKTIIVRVDTARQHRMYKKVVRTSATLHAHDENNDAHIGDMVRVVESRPLSRTKRWRLVEVLERAR